MAHDSKWNLRCGPSGAQEHHEKRLATFFFDFPLRVVPVLQAAQLFAESGSAPVPMFSQEPLDPSDIFGAQ